MYRGKAVNSDTGILFCTEFNIFIPVPSSDWNGCIEDRGRVHGRPGCRWGVLSVPQFTGLTPHSRSNGVLGVGLQARHCVSVILRRRLSLTPWMLHEQPSHMYICLHHRIRSTAYDTINHDILLRHVYIHCLSAVGVVLWGTANVRARAPDIDVPNDLRPICFCAPVPGSTRQDPEVHQDLDSSWALVRGREGCVAEEDLSGLGDSTFDQPLKQLWSDAYGRAL